MDQQVHCTQLEFKMFNVSKRENCSNPRGPSLTGLLKSLICQQVANTNNTPPAAVVPENYHHQYLLHIHHQVDIYRVSKRYCAKLSYHKPTWHIFWGHPIAINKVQTISFKIPGICLHILPLTFRAFKA